MAPSPEKMVSSQKASEKSAVKTRKSSSLPTETVEYLKAWMMSPEHVAHPYPTEQEKEQIMRDTGIELKQLTNWFVNNRKRYWKPRVEARLQQQAQAQSVAAAVVASRRNNDSFRSAFGVGLFTTPLDQSILQNSTSSFLSLDMTQQISHQHQIISLGGKPIQNNEIPSVITDQNSKVNQNSHLFNHHQVLCPTYEGNKTNLNSPISTLRENGISMADEKFLETDRPMVVSVGDASIFSSGESDANSSASTNDFEVVNQCRAVSVQGQFVTFDVEGANEDKRGSPRIVSQSSEVSVSLSDDNLDMETSPMKRIRSSSDCTSLPKRQQYTSVRSRALTFDASQNPLDVKESEDEPQSLSKRRKLRRSNERTVEHWRNACLNASHIYEESLPTLEDATKMFGFCH
mmetsp:Transcript_21206/g.29710  ORF Transcript_21206/g.29710 Transcript_21206/m.29710 type:complete len:403 (-) Transcript_21206:297-1505(-)|eukprot:CAMPEP_0184868180 /NCGR_PEP_ID=MMETSP0580-20130426/29483_1 /TAXON_ID=1118495 /ORGANISM="Dactyliosolen fragilissimus" /LENGTH=402 /DNA_ID=CAMNT_0027368913 /DNA_START=89 /DNA_END=1297 /DNA_ORIENTATION=+